MNRLLPLLFLLLLPIAPDASGQITLTHPNGENMYQAGDTIAITWRAGNPGRYVRIEYSLDAGEQWSTITEKASFSPYVWKIPPTVSSELAMVRVSETVDSAISFEPGGVIHDGSMGLSPDGRHLVTASVAGHSKLWDIETGRLLRQFSDSNVMHLAARFGPDGRQVAVAVGPVLHVYDTAGGEPLYRRRIGMVMAYVVEYSPDGSMIAVAGYDNGGSVPQQVTIVRASDGELLHTIDPKNSQIWFVAFSPDSRRLLVPSLDGATRIYDLATGEPVVSCATLGADPICGAFSPDGSRVAIGQTDGAARLFDAATGRQIALLPHNRSLSSVRFSHNGWKLLTSSQDQLVRLWNGLTGEPIRALNAHTGTPVGAVFSPNDSLILSWAYYDPYPLLWESATGRFLRAFGGHLHASYGGMFTPDGRSVITRDATTVRVWPLAGRVDEGATDRSDATFLINPLPSVVRHADAPERISITPNPASGNTIVKLDPARSARVKIEVIDPLGRSVLPAVGRVIESGTVEIESARLAPGRYIVVIEIGGRREVVPLVVRR